MNVKQGNYQQIFVKRDEEMISLKDDVVAFCEKYIKPVKPRLWDWSKRDFENPKKDPTIEEARAIRNLIHKDLNSKIATDVDLSTITNKEALKAYFNPKSKYEEFNMEEFAFALKVELEHGKIKDVNVTNNHPFLTAMIVLAHMSESLTYYKRLKVMETEAEVYEIMRSIKSGNKSEEMHQMLIETLEELDEAKAALVERLDKMDEFPVMKEIGD